MLNECILEYKLIALSTLATHRDTYHKKANKTQTESHGRQFFQNQVKKQLKNEYN